MENYANLSGESGIAKYLITSDYIIVEFVQNKYTNISFYKYTNMSAGIAVIERMKALAKQGRGLHTYINTPDVKNKYAAKGPFLEAVK